MQIIKRFFILLLFALFCQAASAQKNFLDDANAAFRNENYFSAVELYKKAYAKEKKKTTQAEILFKLGESHRLIVDPKQAEVWYSKAIAAGYPDPIAILHFADALRAQGRYEEAIPEYNKYKAAAPSDKRGADGAKASEMAKKWKDEPTRHQVSPETQINSNKYDFSPTYADRKYNTLIFTSQREGSTGKEIDARIGENYSDLYETKRDKNGKWSTPVLVVGPLNSEFNEGAATVNNKANEIFFTRCGVEKKKIMGCQIYSAKKTGTAWDNPAVINLSTSDTITVGHPALTPAEDVLIFASDMGGGSGGKDLWLVRFDKKAKTWGTPENLGSSINTSGDEMFPFVHDDGTLYFASTGHLGMGGLDIFKAEKAGENQWGTVSNLKYPINSPADDYGIIFEGLSNRGFLTSNREGTMGGDDIFNFYEPPLVFAIQGVISDKETRVPLTNASVKLIGSDGTTAEVKTDATGFFKFAENGPERYVKPNATYTIAVEAADHLGAKGTSTTVGLLESTTFNKDFALQSIKAKEIAFPEVLYDVGKYTLRPESKDSLNYLYQTLIDNPRIVIELSAHTDSRGSDVANQKLSENRAKSCVDYLVTKGIAPERMVAKGYGEKQLLVTDAQIAKLKTTEEKEAAHQKNRRTVFRVLRTDYIPKGGTPPGAGASVPVKDAGKSN